MTSQVTVVMVSSWGVQCISFSRGSPRLTPADTLHNFCEGWYTMCVLRNSSEKDTQKLCPNHQLLGFSLLLLSSFVLLLLLFATNPLNPLSSIVTTPVSMKIKPCGCVQVMSTLHQSCLTCVIGSTCTSSLSIESMCTSPWSAAVMSTTSTMSSRTICLGELRPR